MIISKEESKVMFIKLKKEDLCKDKIIYHQFSDNFEPIPIRIARIDICDEFDDYEEAYLPLEVEELRIIDKTDESPQMMIKPLIVTTEKRKLPDGWPIGRAAEAPIVSVTQTKMSFVGRVADLIRIEDGIDPYTNGLNLGCVKVVIVVEDFHFEIRMIDSSSIVHSNPMFKNAFSDYEIPLPRIGDLVSGTVDTGAIVLRR